MTGRYHHAATSFTHLSGKLLRQLLLACLVLTGLVACGSATVGGGYNATTRVQEYLEDAGYEVRPQREFSQRWNNEVLSYGDPIDPTTGHVNQKSFIQIVQAVRDQLRDQTDIGSIVFTDIIEKEIYYEQGMNRVTRFDGVTRKPAIQGAGSGVTAEFDWSRPVAAATMRVAWFNMDLGRVFSGEGGMEVTDAVDTRSGTAFVRRRDVLENENQIDEGIAIAFHPIIAMKKWPGNP